MPLPKLSLVALDCPDQHALAAFYSSITGWPLDPEHVDHDWAQLDAGGGVTIACQRVEGFRPPVWPGTEHPQQAHLDFVVDDLATGEAEVLAAGARLADQQPGGDDFRVFLDPAGHPFCLVTP
jgi:catechol 2,3-dioxygenase-like lactoylglutathione lyase family enzyme